MISMTQFGVDTLITRMGETEFPWVLSNSGLPLAGCRETVIVDFWTTGSRSGSSGSSRRIDSTPCPLYHPSLLTIVTSWRLVVHKHSGCVPVAST